jgi:hypothetical protein
MIRNQHWDKVRELYRGQSSRRAYFSSARRPGLGQLNKEDLYRMRASIVFVFAAVAACGQQGDRTAADTPSARLDTSSDARPTQDAALRFVHRLPADSFPQLPRAVVATLQARRCQIPQTGRGKVGTNVITGAFTAGDQVEWAVVCSINDSSDIFVLNAATGVVVDSVAHSADADWIRRTVTDTWTYSQVIVVAPADFLNTYPGSLPKPIDHDGIGRPRDILYSSQGRWYIEATSD